MNFVLKLCNEFPKKCAIPYRFLYNLLFFLKVMLLLYDTHESWKGHPVKGAFHSCCIQNTEGKQSYDKAKY